MSQRGQPTPGWRAAAVVYVKEMRDALRDRRTLLVVLFSSVAVGPLVLVLLSALVGNVERRAEVRTLVADGMGHAPTLRNYIERQTWSVRDAPADYERRIADSQLGDPVLVVPPDFEDALAHGRELRLVIVTSSANQRAQAGSGRVAQLLAGFDREQATLRLVLRGVAPQALRALTVDERDLAGAATRAAQWTSMLPFFVLMAVLYGALNAALDTTAGERERGSLEPLLMNPVPRASLVLGKWAAVTTVALLIAALSASSFLPAQWLLRSETLAALFHYGLREALLFVALLLPLAAALSALLMAIAIRCRTFKEAQAGATVVVLALSLLPLATVFNQEGDAPWHAWVPGLAQLMLMGRVLRAEPIAAAQWLPQLPVCALLAALAIGSVARRLRGVALA